MALGTSAQHKMIYCCKCKQPMEARLTTGREIYKGNAPNLDSLMYWVCAQCGNHVGCHGATMIPLGAIPTPQLRRMRRRIHEVMDPIWRLGHCRRGEMYQTLNKMLGYRYHTAELTSMVEARRVLRKVKELRAKIIGDLDD